MQHNKKKSQPFFLTEQKKNISFSFLSDVFFNVLGSDEKSFWLHVRCVFQALRFLSYHTTVTPPLLISHNHLLSLPSPYIVLPSSLFHSMLFYLRKISLT